MGSVARIDVPTTLIAATLAMLLAAPQAGAQPVVATTGSLPLQGAPKDGDDSPREDLADGYDDDIEINYALLDFSLVNLPTTLRLPRYKSAFRVTHRFVRPLGHGTFGSLAGDLFGLDSSAIVGLDYRFAIVSGGELGIYRTSDKTIQFFGRQNIIRQGKASPFAVTLLLSIEGTNNFRDVRSPALGAVISHEVPDRAALFLSPVWAHNSNLAPEAGGVRNTFFVGVGGRLRVRPSVFLVVEVVPSLDGFRPGALPASFGVEKQAGGHVFQLNFSNSLGSTFGQIARGGSLPRNWHLGFNISRKFY
jgi:hypothetical protein